MKCWYCGKNRKLGDEHLYKCAHDTVVKAKMKLPNKSLRSITTPCPVEECGVTFSGTLAQVVLESCKHFELYHSEELT